MYIIFDNGFKIHIPNAHTLKYETTAMTVRDINDNWLCTVPNGVNAVIVPSSTRYTVKPDNIQEKLIAIKKLPVKQRTSVNLAKILR